MRQRASPTASPILTEQEEIRRLAGQDRRRVAARKAEEYQ